MAVLYASCCEQDIQLADFSDAEMDKLIEELVNNIFRSKELPHGGVDKPLAGQYGKRFFDGIEKGFGQSLSDADFSTPDFEMLAQLQKNAYVFAAAKTFQEAKAITAALVDSNGKIRSFKDFQVAANLITGKHNRWLKNEYETAIASAQMAAKWVEIQKNKHLLPLLQFDAVIDSHTTQLCTSLDGIVRPVDDAFWQEYYPPNHWKCRSSVRQLAKGSITPVEDIHPDANIPDLFKQNLAENSLAFPATHPYYRKLSKADIEKDGESILRKEQIKNAKQLLKNERVNRSELPAPITFTAKAIKEAINQPHNNYILKNAAVGFVDAVLKQAEYVGKALPNNKPNVRFTHVFKTNLGGKESLVLVQEYNNGEVVFYSFSDSMKILDFLIK